MTTVVRNFTYTKDNGEVSTRRAIEVSAPRKNYLMLDVSELNDVQLAELVDILETIEETRNVLMAEANVAGLIKWRTFKPDNITDKV